MVGVLSGQLFEREFGGGDLAAAFSRADLVLERRYRAARQAPLPLEARAVEAYLADGRLTVWSSTQVPHVLRQGLARALRMEPEAIHVRVPAIGGGFGLKAHVFPEEVVVAALALRLGRRVRWIEDRRENLLAAVHAHDNEVRMRAAVSGGGRILAVEADVLCDVGAYSVYPFSASLEPATAGSAIFAPYALEALRAGGLPDPPDVTWVPGPSGFPSGSTIRYSPPRRARPAKIRAHRAVDIAPGTARW